MLLPAGEDDVMLSRLACQEFPLELMRKLIDEEEENEAFRAWLGVAEEEEAKEFENADELALSGLFLWPSEWPFCLSTPCCLPLSPERLFMLLLGNPGPLLLAAGLLRPLLLSEMPP